LCPYPLRAQAADEKGSLKTRLASARLLGGAPLQRCTSNLRPVSGFSRWGKRTITSGAKALDEKTAS